jgi:hypothetical protein
MATDDVEKSTGNMIFLIGTIVGPRSEHSNQNNHHAFDASRTLPITEERVPSNKDDAVPGSQLIGYFRHLASILGGLRATGTTCPRIRVDLGVGEEYILNHKFGWLQGLQK